MSIQLPLPSNDIDFTIYYKSGCPYSEKAVRLLKNGYNNNTKSPIVFAAYEVSSLMQNLYGDNYNIAKQKLISNLNVNQTTFPICFIKKRYIGGSDKLEFILNNLYLDKNKTKKYFSI